MSRQGSGPDRGTRGRAGGAAYPDRDAYQRDSYLEADAYPVDPGYRGYASGRERERPRPADMRKHPQQAHEHDCEDNRHHALANQQRWKVEKVPRVHKTNRSSWRKSL